MLRYLARLALLESGCLALFGGAAIRLAGRWRKLRGGIFLLALASPWGFFLAGARGETHVAGVPQLSSRPGAPYTIYLDFAGFNFTGSWFGKSPGNVAAFDNVSGSFSAAEQTKIEQVWATVADGYSLFNINVTTIDPAPPALQVSDSSRQYYYDATAKLMHTVMTTSNSWYGDAGGVSQLGVTKDAYPSNDNNGAGAGYHTNWDFFCNTSNVSWDDTTTASSRQQAAQVAIHENGHGFDLSHQSDYAGSTKVNEYSGGDGYPRNPSRTPGTYAPIMGDSYSSQRGAWRQGDASNGTNQDDIYTILSYNPGMQLVDDGIGKSQATATLLPLWGPNANFYLAKGVITPSSTPPVALGSYSADYFSFQSDGVHPIGLKVNDGTEFVTAGTADPMPMLRSTLTILNGAGTAAGTGVEDASTLSETYNGVLAAGTYFAKISSYGGHTQTLSSGTPGVNFNTTYYFDAGSYFLTGSGFAYAWASPMSGFWIDAGAWKCNTVPDGQGVNVLIDSPTTVPLTITVSDARTVGTLVLGNSLSNTTGYTLAPSANGSLTFNNSGGTNTINVNNGSHAISAPLILTGDLLVTPAYNATLTINGNISETAPSGLVLDGLGILVLNGNNTYSGDTTVNSGLLRLTGGRLPAAEENVLDGLTQSGGTNAVADRLHVYAFGVHTLTGGWLTAQDEYIDDYGAFTQTGGSNSLAGVLAIGDPNKPQGSYNLSGGSLSTKYEEIGGLALGIFTQSGGTHTVSTTLELGNAASSSGSYTLSGSGLLSAAQEEIGWSGSGSFTQSGGTHTASSIEIADSPSSAGTYNLNGGLLVLSGLSKGSGAAAFNFGGGTLGAGAPWSSSLNMNLTNAVGPATIDTSGGSISLSGNLSGNGELWKIGAGVLALSGSNVLNGISFVTGGTLQIPSGLLSTPGQYIGLNGSASLVQSGGTNNLRGGWLQFACSPASSSSYILSGSGVLLAGYELVGDDAGASGTFTQSGGTNNATSQLVLGNYSTSASGSYNLSASGVLSVSGTEYVGNPGSGVFTQSGGANAAAYLVLANAPSSSGTYNLYAGLLSSQYQFIGSAGSASGSFTQSGGTNSVVNNLKLGNDSGSSGRYVLSGSGLLTDGFGEYVGLSGSGAFAQSGGTNNAYLFCVGYFNGSSGSYGLSGAGVLNAGYGEYVGMFGAGAFAQSGGTNSIAGNGLIVGYQLGASGSYSLSGSGVLSAAGRTENVGYSGSGAITQSGGTNTAANLVLGNSPSSAGTYNLNGGLLVLSGLSQGGGTAAFNFGGGTLGAGSAWSSGLNMNLTGSGGASVIDTTGGSISLLGNLSGVGGLTKIGAGALSLSGSNVYGGDTTVSAGTLQIPGGLLSSQNEYVGSAGGASLVQSGGTNNLGGNYLFLGYNAATSGSYSLSGPGLLTTAGASELVGLNGSGTFTQSGGTNNLSGGWLELAYNPSSSGSYSLGGSGVLFAGYELVGDDAGARGTFAQTGGTNSVSTKLLLGGYSTSASGSYNLSVPGVLSVSGTEYVGDVGTGVFTQSGGTNSAARLVLGNSPSSAGTYNLNGGRLVLSGLSQGSGSAAFNFGGGTLGAGAPWSSSVNMNLTSANWPTAAIDTTGGNIGLSGNLSGSGGLTKVGANTLTLSGSNTYTGPTYVSGGTVQILGGLLSSGFQAIGFYGSASMVQSGGTNAVIGGNGLLEVGEDFSSSGSYTLIGGLCTASNAVVVGVDGVGTFVQSGGTNNASELQVGGGTGSGSYYLSGSAVLSSSYGEWVGNQGIGTFTQSGGTNSCWLELGDYAGTSGTYNLNGGLLLLSGLYQGSGSAAFNFGGGTLAANVSFSSSLAMTLTGSGGNGNIDTRGHTLTLFGALSGSGGLTKVGSGLLVLSGTDSYLGGTTVNSGTLIATNSRAIQDGTNLYVGDPARLSLLPAAVVRSFEDPVVARLPSEPPSTPNVPVPEPGTLALLTAGAVLLAICRKRRRCQKNR